MEPDYIGMRGGCFVGNILIIYYLTFWLQKVVCGSIFLLKEEIFVQK